MGLIIPVAHLTKVLPSDAADTNSEKTNAVTEASAFVNTWTSKHYETWDEYTAGSDDAYTLEAPREITHICTQIAKHMYYQNIGSVMRDGAEEIDHEERIEYYRKMLIDINVKPTKHTTTVSLDTNGYQLIARNQNILTHKGHIVSLESDVTNIWNIGRHFNIIKGGCIDADEYWNDGWYLDASTYSTTLEGTLHYWRSYRNDGRDYIMSYKTDWNNTSG